jgi:hypothetical protein
MTMRSSGVGWWALVGVVAGCTVPPTPEQDRAFVIAAPVDPPTGLDDPGSPVGAERCDGLDNDVDGDVDEDCYCSLAEVQSCFPAEHDLSGIGMCRAGVQHCVNVRGEFNLGDWSSCEGAVLPADEICGNGIDENCDGYDDPCDAPGPVGDGCVAGEGEVCYPGPPATEGVGLCKAGFRICGLDGSWGPCEGAVLPSDEICGDDLDEDCNGQICP